MARRFRKKREDVLLKSNTAGTSNEISLSVLDATKQALDDEREGLGAQNPSGRTPLGFIRLFTLRGRRRQVSTPTKDKEIIVAEDINPDGEPKTPAITTRPTAGKHARRADTETTTPVAESTGWTPPREEISSRKSRRKRGRMVAGIVGGLAGAALVAVGVWAAVDYFGHQESLRSELDEGLAAVDTADESLMKLDELVAAQASLGAAPSQQQDLGPEAFVASGIGATPAYDDLKPSLDRAKTLLAEAKSAIETYKSEMGDARDYEVANEAIDAIDARLAMIEAGTAVMSTALPLRDAQAKAASGWKSLLEGDASAREAAAVIADTTQDNARTSIERSQSAQAAFQSALQSITDAADLAPSVDLTPYLTYINLRIEAQKAALTADQAYLDRDKTTAAQSNDRYNELDAEAARAAAQLSGDPADLIGNALVAAIKDDVAAYGQERQKAGAADVLLRAYLARR